MLAHPGGPLFRDSPGSGDSHAGNRPVIPKLRSTSKPPSDRARRLSLKPEGRGQLAKRPCQKSSYRPGFADKIFCRGVGQLVSNHARDPATREAVDKKMRTTRGVQRSEPAALEKLLCMKGESHQLFALGPR